ncbi:MAG TPA: UDP-N-acetylglucosamine 2-epimerase (non-hydrolyzing) [Syntrophales bacterium]|nr:UDP-N-acetylglucosamine 2-epimerase (non-hydrolyzing) [Syntrophales bacterium]
MTRSPDSCLRILTVVGARPQFIKAAAVSRAVAARPEITEVIVHTGQHYDAEMSDVFFEELDIPRPQYHLGIGGLSHGAMTGRMMEALEGVMLGEKPHVVLVYGDTDSTLAGALAAVKLHIPVAHVEAGLRSFNRRMPEEINRVLTDHAADLLFAPTETAVRNLREEGIPEERIHLTGDVMYDAALYYRDRARPPRWFADLGIEPGRYVLATVHRAENTDDPVRLRGIFQGLGGCNRPVILPLHPRTRRRLGEFGLPLPENIAVTDPVGYLEMIWLESHAAVIATDSGGMQKEAFFFQIPCVTLREETEWVETVAAGWNFLAGCNGALIAEAISALGPGHRSRSLYGNGRSASSIVHKLLEQSLSLQKQRYSLAR